MIKIGRLVLMIVASLLFGCTTVDVRKIDASRYPVRAICIKQNPQVEIREFLGGVV